MSDRKDQVKEILEAIWRRDTNRIESLVAAGVDIRARNDYVLRRACWFGYLPSVQLLLRLGANANAKNEGESIEAWYIWKQSGGSPITAAASRGHLPIVEHLHWKGADLHTDHEGPLKTAAEGGHLEVFRYLRKNGVDIHHDNEYALRHAAKGGHLLLVIELIAARANLHVNDDEPLYLAAQHGHADVVRQLLLAGANLHADGNRALVAAVKAGHVEVVRLLVERGADVRVNNNEVIRTAAYNGNSALLRHLILAGAEVNVSSDKPYSAPLYRAISNGRLEVARLLIIAGAEVRGLSEQLLYAATVHQEGDIKFLELLLLAGVDIHGGADKPILDAIKHHNFSAVERLLAAGATIPADKLECLLDALLFRRAVYREDQDDDEDERENNEPIPARLNAALNKVARLGHPLLAGWLIQKGADVDAGALSMAARVGELEVVHALIAAGANCSAREGEAITLADAEYEYDDIAYHNKERCHEIVRVLLANGKLSAPDHRKEFPPSAALKAAAEDERDVKALFALHQHGLESLLPIIHSECDREVILRYFSVQPYELDALLEEHRSHMSCGSDPADSSPGTQNEGRANAVTRDEMIAQLFEMGFKPQATVSQKWKNAFFFSNGERTLFVLVRARGIDLLETPLKREEMTRDDGLLRVSMHREGDRFGEYYYTDSHIPINETVIEVATRFIQGLDIDSTYFQKVGIGRSEWGAKYGENSKRLNDGGDHSDVYDAVCAEPGEPAYLGDGVWISPDGSLDDRS